MQGKALPGTGLALPLAEAWCSLQMEPPTYFTCAAFPGTHPCLFLKQGVVLPPQNACLIPQRNKGNLPICQSPVSHPKEHVAVTCSAGEAGATLWAGAQLTHHGDQDPSETCS